MDFLWGSLLVPLQIFCCLIIQIWLMGNKLFDIQLYSILYSHSFVIIIKCLVLLLLKFKQVLFFIIFKFKLCSHFIYVPFSITSFRQLCTT